MQYANDSAADAIINAEQQVYDSSREWWFIVAGDAVVVDVKPRIKSTDRFDILILNWQIVLSRGMAVNVQLCNKSSDQGDADCNKSSCSINED